MNNPKISIAVLDACVLYPAPLRDILMHLAIQKTFQPKWSNIINEEWKRNLLINRPDLDEKKLDRTIKLMTSTFPNANVVAFDFLIEELNLPDEDDRHVLAAAIKSNANYIVTFNLKDFPNSVLKPYTIKAIHPDKFICELFKYQEIQVKQALDNQISLLNSPPKTKKEVLKMLEKCGLTEFVTLFE